MGSSLSVGRNVESWYFVCAEHEQGTRWFRLCIFCKYEPWKIFMLLAVTCSQTLNLWEKIWVKWFGLACIYTHLICEHFHVTFQISRCSACLGHLLTSWKYWPQGEISLALCNSHYDMNVLPQRRKAAFQHISQKTNGRVCSDWVLRPRYSAGRLYDMSRLLWSCDHKYHVIKSDLCTWRVDLLLLFFGEKTGLLYFYRTPNQFSSPPYTPPPQMQRSYSSPDSLQKHAMVTQDSTVSSL